MATSKSSRVKLLGSVTCDKGDGCSGCDGRNGGKEILRVGGCGACAGGLAIEKLVIKLDCDIFWVALAM